jgi:protein SCO1/2
MWRFSKLLLFAVASFNAAAFDEKLALRESQAALGRQVANYRFLDSKGNEIRFAELRGKPLVVSFIYTGCSQVCPTTTQFLATAVRDAERTLGPGTFRVATIGFNLPFDDPTSMRAFARKFGIASPNWLFLTPDADSLSGITKDLGFRYEATAAGFDHLLQVSILDRDGRVYRQVYGESFETPLFVGPLLQLAQNAPVEQANLEGAWEKFKLLCTVYDPAAGRYRVNYAVVIELLVGASVMLGGISFVLWEWRRRRLTHIKSKAQAAS